MPHRLHVPRAGELHAAKAELRHAIDLLHGGVDVAVGQAGQTDVAVGIVAAEVLQPVVVDPEHLVGGLRVVEPRGGAEDAVDHLGLDAVAVHVLHAQGGIGGPADALLAVFVEPGRGHDVDPIVRAGDVLRSGRADAVHEAEGSAVAAGPVRTVRPVRDVRHPLLHRGRRVRGEEVGRNPGQVDVAVGRDSRVFHGAPHSLYCFLSRTSSYGAEYGKAGIRVRAGSSTRGPTPRMNPFSQIGANTTRS